MWEQRIAQDDEVVFGKIRIEGSRICLSIILNLLANGNTEQEIIEVYPNLTNKDIEATLWMAHNIVRYHEIRKDLKLEDIINLNQIEEISNFTSQLDLKHSKWIRFLITKAGFRVDNSPYYGPDDRSHIIRLFSNISEDMGHFMPIEIDFNKMIVNDTGRVISEQFLHGNDGLTDLISQYVEYYGIKIEKDNLVMDIVDVKDEYVLISSVNDFISTCRFLINCFINNKTIPRLS